MFNKLSDIFQCSIDITRVKKPAGSILLLIPCLIGVFFVKGIDSLLIEDFKIITLLVAGSFIMRSAGCIINDILDVKFDKKVQRTKNRPLASGKMSVVSALILLIILLSFGLVILLQFNKEAIICGVVAFFLVLTYPTMKRITFYPQIFLGIVFNIGFLLVILQYNQRIVFFDFLLYLALISITYVYDTIYGFQDIDDDLKIGVKSSSIIVSKKPSLILGLVTLFSFLVILCIGVVNNYSFNFFIFNFLYFVLALSWVINCNFKNKESCYELFRFFIVFELLILISFILK